MVTVHLFGPMTIEPAFYQLPNVQRDAVMCHEEGHRALRHLWVQLFYMFWASDARMTRLRHAQEFEADAYAALRGHASALVNVLRLDIQPATPTHPATKERIARLML